MPSTVSQHDRHKQPHFESSELMAMSINIWRTSSRTMSKIGVRTMKRLAQGLRRCRDAFRRNSALAWAPNVDCVSVSLCPLCSLCCAGHFLIASRDPRSTWLCVPTAFRPRSVISFTRYFSRSRLPHWLLCGGFAGVWCLEPSREDVEMEKCLCPVSTRSTRIAIHRQTPYILFYSIFRDWLDTRSPRTVRTVLEWADASQLLP